MVSRTILALFSVAVIAATLSDASAFNFGSHKIGQRGLVGKLLEWKLNVTKSVLKHCWTEVLEDCQIDQTKHTFEFILCAKKYGAFHLAECSGLGKKKENKEEPKETSKNPKEDPKEKTEETPKDKTVEEPKDKTGEEPKDKTETKPDGKTEDKTTE